MAKTTTKQLAIMLSKSNYSNNSFAEEFNTIIENGIDGYNGNVKQQLKSFFEDLQHGGCQSGMIGDFIYNSDCKEFYVKHLDDLEDMVIELEESLGEDIPNRQKLPHYTFICWLCFEEYCYDLYRTIFES